MMTDGYSPVLSPKEESGERVERARSSLVFNLTSAEAQQMVWPASSAISDLDLSVSRRPI